MVTYDCRSLKVITPTQRYAYQSPNCVLIQAEVGKVGHQLLVTPYANIDYVSRIYTNVNFLHLIIYY